MGSLGFLLQEAIFSPGEWSVFDPELWACFAGIRHFWFILEGRCFTIFTDHKPLTYALSRSTDAWTAKQCRHLSYVAEFTSDIQHVPGLQNLVADAFSRLSSSPSSSRSLADPPGLIAGASPAPVVIDWSGVASRQATCTSVQSTTVSSSLQVEARLHEGIQLLCQSSQPSRAWLTLARGPREDWCQHMLSGVAWHQIWQIGADHVSNANVPK